MKKFLKYTSLISIILTGILYILYRFFDIEPFGNSDIRGLVIIIYLASTLYYYKLELKDKNAEIQKLKYQLSKKE